MAISNIDDLLMGGGGNSQQPEVPENKPELEGGHEPDSTYEDEPDDNLEPDPQDHDDDEPEDRDDHRESDDDDDEPKQTKKEYDDYGNEKAKPRTYNEDEVNERINKAVRERLSRGNNDQTPANANQGQPANNSQAPSFAFDENSDASWEQQLESFVEHTVSRMGQKQSQQQMQQREQQAESEFREKFTRGMEKFGDFQKVVEVQPITDAMTLALRGIKDPASFIYAASKRNAPELARISQIPDQYVQMVEMGKLEERMRKAAPTTKAPRPVARTKEDGSLNLKSGKKVEPTIEDLIHASDRKRQAKLNASRRR